MNDSKDTPELAKGRPSGRDEIISAVLDAATELFSTRPPSAVSVRDIAKLAGVQHSVVHRYFGTKEDLLRTVIMRGSEKQAAQIATLGKVPPAVMFEGTLAQGAIYRTILLASIDGRDPAELMEPLNAATTALDYVLGQPDHPHAGTEGPTFDPRILVAFVMAATFGWQGAERTLLHATGLRDADPAEVRSEVARILYCLLQLTDEPSS
ncbi:MAG: helix-turn-helix transcriptional regulator [Coriobacteriales bacterium]|nr:helix-turn-helix transcriptional regulator [Coriobacteriales bacterium]